MYDLFVLVMDILACFHLSASMKNAAMNICVQMSVCVPAFSSLDLCSEVELLDHTVILFLMF